MRNLYRASKLLLASLFATYCTQYVDTIRGELDHAVMAKALVAFYPPSVPLGHKKKSTSTKHRDVFEVLSRPVSRRQCDSHLAVATPSGSQNTRKFRYLSNSGPRCDDRKLQDVRGVCDDLFFSSKGCSQHYNPVAGTLYMHDRSFAVLLLWSYIVERCLVTKVRSTRSKHQLGWILSTLNNPS